MIAIPGYRIKKEVFRGNRRIYYAAENVETGAPVIIKTHFPGAGDGNNRLRHEYHLLKDQQAEQIPRVISLESNSAGLALVMEYFEGELLSDHLEKKRFELAGFLNVAISLAAAIGDLHRRRIIHKDIQPENIVIDTAAGRAWIVDFRYATVLPKETPSIADAAILEGSLRYISPEQTGRMNRPLDYRTDFYSLGVLFFQMLTGHLPFNSDDPLELVHGHIAKQPPAPHEIDPKIPEVVSRIVLKLLSKNAEERYLSGHGLTGDLKKCLRQLDDHRAIESFPLGDDDLPEKFRISRKIYGREREVKKLLDLFERSDRWGAAHMAAISGRPGIGKTSVVQEVSRPITGKKGYFISGKCDPFHQNVPYNPLVHALGGLVKQLLTESEDRLGYWRGRLRSALGAYGQIVIDVIPDVELVIGPQPALKKLDLMESQNRFNRVFMDFIRAIADAEHPLLIFLDDLQWVDAATLKLLEVLMTDSRIGHLFLIITYRDNEVGSGHPLTAALESLEQKKCAIHRLHLEPLGLGDTVQLLSDTLHSGPPAVEPLAELVVHKTGGNPFFINQFLNLLYQEELLFFNSERGGWEWKLATIRALDITENVVELLLRRLEYMPAGTRHVMRMAACIGSEFDLGTLVDITGYSKGEITDHLLPAIKEDLVVIIPAKHFTPIAAEPPATAEHFKFRHDRVRQASYSLIAEENIRSIHLSIGKILLDNLDPMQQAEDVFVVIHHLNMAADLISDRTERDEIAELNLLAGNKAKSMAAFEPAFNYFNTGLHLLDAGSWQRRYDLTLRLHVECTEAARLCGRFDRMESLFATVVAHARHVLDRVDVYQSRILAFISENRRLEALAITRQVLEEIGVTLPARPTGDDVRAILGETIAESSGRTMEDLLSLPEMRNPYHLAAMKIMGSVFGASYQLSLEWFVVLVCEQVKLSLRHGNHSNSAIAYGGFGIILCGYIGDIDMGHRLGRLGLEILKRFDARELEAKMHTIYYAGVHHWKHHLRETLEFLLAAHHTGMETGDFEFSSYNTFFYSSHSFHTGKPLGEVGREMVRFSETCNQLHQTQTLIYISIYHQTVANLQGDGPEPWRLKGVFFDEEAMLPRLNKTNDTLAIFYMYCCKIILCHLFGNYSEAVVHADAAAKVSRFIPGNVVIPIYYEFDSLSRLAACDSASDEMKKEILARVDANQEKMKGWIAHAPMNHGHRYHLVEAESARIRGEIAEAIRNYDLAVRMARQNGYVNDEALANECAARFWLNEKHLELAEIFMHRAGACYEKWGAVRKIDHLHATFPGLFPASMPPDSLSNDAGENHWKKDGFDLSTLMKSAQAISGEIVLKNLLCTMMKIVIENAGAQKGFLILNLKEALRLAARGTSGIESVFVEPIDLAVEDSGDISHAVIHFVARTREPVVLKNAAEAVQFGNDPYIRSQRPKSVLCIPIIYKSKLTGIIYLENRLAPDVFSTERIEMLKLLTSQMAVSIENTILFEEQKKAEEKYRGIFENAVEGIFLSNPEGRFISANPAMAQILGYDSPDDLYARVTDIESQLYAYPETRRRFLRLLRKSGTIKDFETEFRRKNGTFLWVSLNARSIFNENGELEKIEGFIIDISERKAATDALKQREEFLRRENTLLRSNIKDRYKFGRIIGKSVIMQEVYDLILKAAATDATVIIYGESGTGKELVARAIYEMSDRKNGSFIPVNCGAIPENLLESEFFGYKKGAFTGAGADKQGYLDMAQGGVLFLDELGEISPHFQVKLLRALEDGSYTPLGGQAVKYSDARVVAATSRDLQESIRKGLMREDFFYRIHIIPVYLPPLRKRKEDIPLLIEHYLKQNSRSDKIPAISGEIIEALLSYNWPGNVRELQNVIHRYITLGRIDFLPVTSRHSPATDEKSLTDDRDYRTVVGDAEKLLITDALEKFQWRRKKAAEALGIPLRSFYRKLKQYGIS